jgi:hypothetical protein
MPQCNINASLKGRYFMFEKLSAIVIFILSSPAFRDFKLCELSTKRVYFAFRSLETFCGIIVFSLDCGLFCRK